MNNQKHMDTVSVFENPSIGRAVWTLAIPTVITQLINMIYNFADTWFVGRTGNAAMVAATNVCMPLFVIMAAIANLFGTRFLRIIGYAAPLCALSYMCNTVFQATGNRARSFVLSIMRKGLVDIPMMFVLRAMIGVDGVCWATPFAEVVSAVIAVILYFSFMKKLTPARA